MLKAPRPGLVKTRLAREAGKIEAARIYRHLVHRQLRALPSGWPVIVWYAPPGAGREMKSWLGPTYRYRPQCAGDLGRRLVHAVRQTFHAGARRVIFLGGDCPYVSAPDLRRTARSLRKVDVVLGPATDGGYYLVGLRRPEPVIFRGIAWSTDRVLRQTLEAVKQAGLTHLLLEELEDVDDVAAWSRTGLLP